MLTSEVTSDGYGGWMCVSRSTQIWEMISKAISKRIECRHGWAEWYNIKAASISKSNTQKVHDIKKFIEQSEYAYLKRIERLLKELNETQTRDYKWETQ